MVVGVGVLVVSWGFGGFEFWCFGVPWVFRVLGGLI